ncbi:ATP-dependent RNA helicase, partial [Tulasnella sp. 403]
MGMPLTVVAAPPRHVLERRRRKNQVFHTKSRFAAQKTFHGVDADEEGDNEPPRKKQKRTRKMNELMEDDLDWHPVEAKGATMDAEGAMYMLEEIEGVNVVYGEPGSGATFSITRKTKAGERKPNASRPLPSLLMYPEDDQMDDVNAQNLLPQWGDLQLKGSIKRALHALGFEAPTEIQKLAIPKALEGRDVIGVAET